MSAAAVLEECSTVPAAATPAPPSSTLLPGTRSTTWKAWDHWFASVDEDAEGAAAALLAVADAAVDAAPVAPDASTTPDSRATTCIRSSDRSINTDVVRPQPAATFMDDSQAMTVSDAWLKEVDGRSA